MTWVTALTVASLLLGSGAINALADGGRGGGGHGHDGGGQGNAEHAQSVSAAQSGRHDDAEGADDHGVVHVAGPQHPVSENTGGGHGNDGGHGHDNHVTTTTTTTAVVSGHHDDDARVEDEHQNRNQNVDVEREDEDNDDLVTPEVEETEEVRPGLGCGDDNHEHSGPPGNPGMVCRHDDADDDGGAMNNDDGSAQTEAVTTDDDSSND